MKNSWTLAVVAVLLAVVAGCSTSDPVSKTISLFTGVTSAQSTSGAEFGVPPETVSASPSTGPASTGPGAATTDTTEISVVAADETDPSVVRCGKLLSRGEIGRRVGAGFSAADKAAVVAPDPVGRLLAGLTCLYAVDATYPAGIVQVGVNDFADTEAATAWVDGAVSSRVANGAVDTALTIGDAPAHILVLEGGLVVLQSGSRTLTVGISAGVVTAPELVGAVSALAEYSLSQL